MFATDDGVESFNMVMQKWGCIMKKIISLSLCAAIFVGCGIPACAEFRGNQIMSAQEEARIMERYEQELEYIAITSNTAISSTPFIWF